MSLVRILKQQPSYVQKLMQTLDHVDTEKVTWAEFMNWLAKEGIIRNIANDQRLYAFSITRIEEENTYIMKQMQVQNMVNIEVEDGFNFFLVVYENREVDLVKQKNLDQKVYSFKFISQYKKPKRLKDYPIHKQRKLRPFTANVNKSQVASRRLGVSRQLNNNIIGDDRKSLINQLESIQQQQSSLQVNIKMIDTQSLQSKDRLFNQTVDMSGMSTQRKIINTSEKPRQVRPYQILGLSDTTKDTDEVREILRMKQENQQNNKKRDQYFHTFGLDDRLFTPKNDQVKHERNFKGLIQGLEGILDDQEKQIKEIQLQKELRQSLLDLQLDDSKKNLLTKFQTMKDEKSQKRFTMTLNQENSQMRNSLQNKVVSRNLIGLRGKKSVDINIISRQLNQTSGLYLKSKISQSKNYGSRNQGSLDKRNKSIVPTAQSLQQQFRDSLVKATYFSPTIKQKAQTGQYNNIAQQQDQSFVPQQQDQIMKLEDLDMEELKKDLLQRKTEELNSKLKQMNPRVNHIQELSQYFVKVADSCPLAIEQKTQKNRQNRSKYPVSDQEREQLRQLAMKKQQFLDKISKEIEEKERLKLLKKKQRIQEGLLNYDDSDYADSDCDSTDSARLRKKDTKKIYPVTISYYQETKLLAICLIDCDVKIYSLKMQGTSLHVNDYYNFQASYLPVSSHLARYKLNNNVVLCLASQEGQVEIYSMDEKEKGKIIWSIKLHGLVSDHGPISKIYYHKDVGLIISTFKGLLQVYDSMEFKLLWETHNYIRKEKTTITTFDFSQYTGFIACGGVEGKLLLFDPSARILSQSAPKAHNSEIISVYFYDKHMQLISISNDRTIQLWDSLKLECIQTIKDTSNQATRFYQSTCFNQNKGILLTACVFIKVWRARIDKNVEFESVQRKAITKNALKEQVKRIQRQIDIIDKGDNIEQDQQKMKDQLNEELVASQTYITSGFDHLQNYTETGNVLVTGSSKLVSVIILESKDQLITLDSDYLMRIWSLQTGKQVTTLLLKTHLKNNSINKKLTSAAVDPKEKYLAVSDEEGLITIHNIHSAGILHSLQKIGTEMTQLQFLTDNTNYWLSAVGWEGKVAFIKLPMFQKNTYTIPIMLKKSVHTGDIFSIDHTEQYAATGGVDNKVCLWNVQSGTVRSMVELPKERPNTFISSVKFAKTSKQTLLFIIQNTGQMHCINPITEVLTENCLKLQTNAHIDFSYDLEYMLSVGESGKGSLLSTKLEDISPKNSFVKSKSKYQTRKSMGNLSTKNGKEDKINTSVQSMNINEYDFDLCFDVVKEWTLHKIMPQNNQAVIMCKFSKYKKYFITATNHGEVKIWDFNGECLSLINQSNYPERQLSKILKQDIQESKNDRNTSKSRPIHTKQRSPIIELSYHSSSDELDL
eukprot:403339298